MSSRQLEEIQEAQQHADVARALGISSDDLAEMEWTIDENASDDGTTYGYIVTFDDNTPEDLLAKIQADRDGKTVWLGHF